MQKLTAGLVLSLVDTPNRTNTKFEAKKEIL